MRKKNSFVKKENTNDKCALTEKENNEETLMGW